MLQDLARKETQSETVLLPSYPKHNTLLPYPSASLEGAAPASMSPVTALLAGTVVPPASAPSPARHARHYSVGFSPLHGGGRAALAVESSSRPQKKGTKHHMKTRPKKTQPWDIKRRPTQYPPLPPLPPDWTLVASGATVDVEEAEAPAPAATLVLDVAAAAD